jgi:hypothetical protein
MQRMLVILGVSLVLSSACNSSQKMGQGAVLKGEAGGAEKVAAIKIETTSDNRDAMGTAAVFADSSETANQTSSSAEIDPDADDSENKTASEPVPVGGAYLTCRYSDGQKQASESYQMECEVAPLVEVKVPIATALFYKIDAQGNRSALNVMSQDLPNLKWIVEDKAATLSSSQVQVVLGVPGLLSVTLSSTVNGTLQLVQNPLYWLGGEPNNLTADEDCAEIVPLNGVVSHQEFTGLASGPLGRINDIVCSVNRNFLCRNISAGASAPKWRASPGIGPFANGATACTTGYSFSFPMSDAESREIIALVDQLNIKLWINMSDAMSEGTFHVKFR